MNNALQVFENEEFGQVRTEVMDDKIYFCGKDIAECLGYTNPQKALRDHCKDPGVTFRSVGVQTGLKANGEPAIQQVQLKFISEGNVYRLIAHSKLPNAESFESWVFDEVLPSIRKHGMYATPATAAEIISNPDTMIEILQALKTEREQRIAHEKEVKQLTQKAEEDKPKVDFADRLIRNDKNTILVRDMAKLITQNGYKIGQNQLFAYLRANGYLISSYSSDRNLPTQRYMNSGLFAIDTRIRTDQDGNDQAYRVTKLTPKGQKYFLEIFMTLKKAKELAKEQKQLAKSAS